LTTLIFLNGVKLNNLNKYQKLLSHINLIEHQK